MLIPERVKVGPAVYSVELNADKIIDMARKTDTSHYGYSDHKVREIVIDPGCDSGLVAEILWHEVRHCIYHVVGRTGQDMEEEEAIECSAPMEVLVLRENPELLHYLIKEQI